MTRIGLRFFLITLLLLASSNCSPPATIMVSVANVPAQSATLSVLIGQGNRISKESLVYDVAGRSTGGDYIYTFGLQPIGLIGTFSLAVAAYNEKDCLIATGTGTVDVDVAVPNPQLQLRLRPLASEPVPVCFGPDSSTPQIISFSQKEDDPTRATIYGWRLLPGATFSLDGKQISDVTWQNFTSIEASLPLSMFPSGMHRALLSVTNPDGYTTARTVPVYSISFAHANNAYQLDVSLEPTEIQLGDVDKDGTMDIVLTGLRNTTRGFMATYRNQGAGRLAAPRIIEMPYTVDGFQLVDINGDRWLDLVAFSGSAQQLVVVLNDGTGNFAMASALNLAFPAGSSAVSLAVGNILGDSFPDIVVLSNATPGALGAILFYLGGASGLSYIGSLTLGTVLFGNVTVRDIDNNGRDDLVVAEILPGVLPNPLVGYVQVFLSNGDGSFGIKPNLPTAAGYYHQVVAMNLGSDPLLDLVVSGAFTTSQLPGTTLSVFINQGSGNFPVNRTEFSTSLQPFSMAVGDINRDGLADLALTHTFKEGAGRLSILLNLGGNSGFADVTLQPSFPIGFGDNYVASGDLDGDGKVDLAVINRGSLKLNQPAFLQLFLNRSLSATM